MTARASEDYLIGGRLTLVHSATTFC